MYVIWYINCCIIWRECDLLFIVIPLNFAPAQNTVVVAYPKIMNKK